MACSKVATRGCLVLVGLFILLAIIGLIAEALKTPEQRAAEQAAAAKEKAEAQAAIEKRQAAEVQAAEGLIQKFTLLRRRLPRDEDLREVPGPASLAPEKIIYEPIDYGFVMQFAETGFSPLEAAQVTPWYRGKIIEEVQKTLITDQISEKRNAALAHAAAGLDKKPYFIVFLPLEERWPKINDDHKTYKSGYFIGWEIVIDAKTIQPICQTKFGASNSAEVNKTRLKLVGVPIGSGIDSAVEENFTNNFWEAAIKALSQTRAP